MSNETPPLKIADWAFVLTIATVVSWIVVAFFFIL